MNDWRLKFLSICLFTVMHSNGFVTIVATVPATIDDMKLYFISFYLNNDSPCLDLKLFIIPSYIVNWSEIKVVYVKKKGVRPWYNERMPF